MKEQFLVVIPSLKYSSVTFFLRLFLASGLWHMKYSQNRIEKLWHVSLHRHFADIRSEMHVTALTQTQKSEEKKRVERLLLFVCLIGILFECVFASVLSESSKS